MKKLSKIVMLMCLTLAAASAYAANGRLALDVSPEPVEVFVDGQKHAEGSGALTLTEGSRELVIKKSGSPVKVAVNEIYCRHQEKNKVKGIGKNQTEK